MSFWNACFGTSERECCGKRMSSGGSGRKGRSTWFDECSVCGYTVTTIHVTKQQWPQPQKGVTGPQMRES